MEIDAFYPAISRWFKSRFERTMPIQSETWHAVAEKRNVLISATTGSGKTLAAFLWSINEIVQGNSSGRVLYVSPLKALNNDIHRNLLGPLTEIRAMEAIPPVTVGVRSGDSSSRERAQIIRHPPDIFICTPEAINIMLTSESGRNNLSSISTVIIDEIHILTGSKRGTLFMTNLERLEDITQAVSGHPLRRIAMSATVRPLEDVAAFLGGFDNAGLPRPVHIIQDSTKRKYSIEVKLGQPTHPSWWDRQIPLIASEIDAHECTLIFCNSRRASEKAAYLLNNYFGEKYVFVHHGSLSREYRYWVEQELKAGKLKAVAATSSLELGIDIGTIDRVLLIQPPFSMTAAIQRIGRSRHQVDQEPSAAFIPLHPRDILKSIVQANAVREGDIEPVKISQNCLDILAQVILSETAGRRVSLTRLKDFLKRSWAFHSLPNIDLDRVLDMLAGRYEESRVHELQARILIHDDVDEGHVLEGKESNRFLIYQSGGTIPDRGYFDMRISGSKEKIAELDEEFVFERNLNDRFTLGNRVWMIDHIDNQKVLVSPSKQSSMITPFWKADALGTDDYSSEKYNCALEQIHTMLNKGNTDLKELFSSKTPPSLDAESARELLTWLQNQQTVSGADIPHRRHLLLEQLTDPTITPDTIHFIVHSNWGASVNATLMFCLQAKFKDTEGLSLQGLYTDEVVIFSLPLTYDGFNVFQNIHPHEIVDLLGKQLAGTGIFGSRFRMNSARALLVLRRGFNQRTPLWLQRMKSRKLFETVMALKDFPVTRETWREVLENDLSVQKLQQYLTEIEDGYIRIGRIVTKIPTPFAADILWQLNSEYLYRDDSLESAQGVLPGSGIFTTLINETAQLPEIEANIQSEYLLKRRRLMKEYQPESEEELRFYFQDRRIFTQEEQNELFITLDHELPVQEMMENVFYPSTIAGQSTVIYLNKDIKPKLLADTNMLRDLALEWFDWQAMIDYEHAVHLWGNSVIESLVSEEQIVLWHNSCVEKQVFERLLRMRRNWLRKKQGQLSYATVQYRSALLNDICMYTMEESDRISPDAHPGIALEGLSGMALPPEAFIQGLFPARFGRVEKNTLEGEFRQSNMVWTGLGKNRIIISTETELPRYLHTSNKGPLSRVPLHDEGLLPPGGGRYSFGHIHSHTGKTSEKVQKELQKFLYAGKVANDSYRAMVEVAEGSWADHSPRALRATMPGRRHRQNWQDRYNISGLWFEVPKYRSPDNPEETMEELRLYIYQLLDRYPLLNKEIVNNEYTGPRWHTILPVLRQMEMAGELIGGKICNELVGLQFCPSEDNPSEKLYKTWFWLNSHDPALLPGPIENKKGKHNYALLCVHGRESQVFAHIKNGGKDIELHEENFPSAQSDLIPDILVAFFRMVLLESTQTSVRLLTIDTIPAMEHPLHELLTQRGFVNDRQGLKLWKY